MEPSAQVRLLLVIQPKDPTWTPDVIRNAVYGILQLSTPHLVKCELLQDNDKTNNDNGIHST